jgi:hypothetical protein
LFVSELIASEPLLSYRSHCLRSVVT